MRRPELGCGAEWTPCASEGGVQIVDVGQNGRHVLMRAASRLWMWGGMDASVVQCGDEAASRLWMWGGMDAM